MQIDRDTLTQAQELELWRENSRRLAAALRLARSLFENPDADHVLVGNPAWQLTSGDIMLGALELNEKLNKELEE